MQQRSGCLAQSPCIRCALPWPKWPPTCITPPVHVPVEDTSSHTWQCPTARAFSSVTCVPGSLPSDPLQQIKEMVLMFGISCTSTFVGQKTPLLEFHHLPAGAMEQFNPKKGDVGQRRGKQCYLHTGSEPALSELVSPVTMRTSENNPEMNLQILSPATSVSILDPPPQQSGHREQGWVMLCGCGRGKIFTWVDPAIDFFPRLLSNISEFNPTHEESCNPQAHSEAALCCSVKHQVHC